jgi:hypothetical protein
MDTDLTPRFILRVPGAIILAGLKFSIMIDRSD